MTNILKPFRYVTHLSYPKGTRSVFRKSVYRTLHNLSDNSVENTNGNDQKPGWVPFRRADHGSYTVPTPELTNEYLSDGPLQGYLKRTVPKNILDEITPDLVRFGGRTATELASLARDCELNPPRLTTQNAWGQRVDELWTCDAWKKQHAVAAEEGIVAHAYHRRYAEWSRLYQAVKLYLYAPSSGLYSCPLAMTDGAARSIEVLDVVDPLFKDAFDHLTSFDPKFFWTSGQWMTEKKGGSDVASGTDTVAVPQEDGSYKLYGYKWFSSATDANISLTLARIVDDYGNVLQGSKGLTLFFLKVRDDCDKLNNIQMVRLKDKLGTRQLPTAELLLDGSTAYKMSDVGRGVASISTMLTLTRIYNSIGAISGMRRILSLARDYAQKRVAFGLPVFQHPLHMIILSRMEVEIRGSLLLVMEIARLLGKQECGLATDEENLLLRILVPVAKLYTAKQAVQVATEGVESFGGQGYMEDTGLGCMLRDAQVLPIWEGTTNVLSLDVLRSIVKTNGEVLKAFRNSVITNLKTNEGRKTPKLKLASEIVQKSLGSLEAILLGNPEVLQVGARDFAYSLARIYSGSLLIQQANSLSATNNDVRAAERWCLGQDLKPLSTNFEAGLYEMDEVKGNTEIVMENYQVS